METTTAPGAPDGDSNTDTTATDGNDDTATSSPAPTVEQAADSGKTEGDLASLPEWAQKALKDARSEAAKARTNAKQQAADQARQALAQDIGKALGIVKDDKEKADPAKLAEQLASQQAEARQARVELAVYKIAAKHGADASAALDSRAFLAAVKDIDPGDEKQLAAALIEAVKANPKLAAAPAGPGKSGAPIPGGSSGRTSTTTPSLNDAVAARYGM
jgi:hypothetical protein